MKVALVGNQNSGKTSLFNALTGNNQKVGNWPGVTIEKKEGIIKNTNIELIDLPGIYSLSPYTLEEEITSEYVLKEKIDVIINIIDATSLERSLYLTTQLMELDCPILVALNMCDLLSKKGLVIDEKKLQDKLGLPVLRISALKGIGIDDIIDLLNKNNIQKIPKKIYPKDIEKYIELIADNITCRHNRFLACKILEQDENLTNLNPIPSKLRDIRQDICHKYGMGVDEIIASSRYDFIVKNERSYLQKYSTKSVTDRIDRVVLNKYLALPIFVLIMGLIYFLSVGIVGNFTSELINSLIINCNRWLERTLGSCGASPWAISLICDGIVSGVGAVLSYVPQLLILFVCISLLETSGYMSRIAFFLDKIFIKFGLSGKSLIPFIVGAGCSVPGIMSTRIIENQEEKDATIMLTPFIPCSAKLPLISLIAGWFFGSSWIVAFSLYLLSIGIIIFSAVLIRKFVFQGTSTHFISELPEYKFPSLKYVIKDSLEKIYSFIRRAGTLIFLCSIVTWFLLSFNFRLEYGVDIEYSILAYIGKFFSWIFYPVFGRISWPATVSTIQGIIAKEQVVSSMSIIAGLSSTMPNSSIFTSSVFSFFTPVSAYAFVVFNLFSAPCVASIGAMAKEFGSRRKTFFAVGFQMGIAWVVASTINIVGSLILF